MACPTCGGMFANNTKFLDHIRRQTSLDRKPSESSGYRPSCLQWGRARSQGGWPLELPAAWLWPRRAQAPPSLLLDLLTLLPVCHTSYLRAPSQQPREVGFLFPFLQMRKLSLREVKPLT